MDIEFQVCRVDPRQSLSFAELPLSEHSLRQQLSVRKELKCGFTTEQLVAIASAIVQAVNMHQAGTNSAHGALFAQNVILDAEGGIRLLDPTQSRVSAGEAVDHPALPPQVMAVLHLDSPCEIDGHKATVYQLGVLLFQCIDICDTSANKQLKALFEPLLVSDPLRRGSLAQIQARLKRFQQRGGLKPEPECFNLKSKQLQQLEKRLLGNTF